jgi:hypothetical protein
MGSAASAGSAGEIRQGWRPGNDGTGRSTRLPRKSLRLVPAASIQFLFSGIGARSSSSLERNSLRIGDVFDLL